MHQHTNSLIYRLTKNISAALLSLSLSHNRQHSLHIAILIIIDYSIYENRKNSKTRTFNLKKEQEPLRTHKNTIQFQNHTQRREKQTNKT